MCRPGPFGHVNCTGWLFKLYSTILASISTHYFSFLQDLDVTLTPHDGRWSWILNHLKGTKTTEKSWSLTTNSKFRVIYYRVASMWHPNKLSVIKDRQKGVEINAINWKWKKTHTLHLCWARTTDAWWRNRLHCTAKNQIPVPNF